MNIMQYIHEYIQQYGYTYLKETDLHCFYKSPYKKEMLVILKFNKKLSWFYDKWKKIGIQDKKKIASAVVLANLEKKKEIIEYITGCNDLEVNVLIAQSIAKYLDSRDAFNVIRLMDEKINFYQYEKGALISAFGVLLNCRDLQIEVQDILISHIKSLLGISRNISDSESYYNNVLFNMAVCFKELNSHNIHITELADVANFLRSCNSNLCVCSDI